MENIAKIKQNRKKTVCWELEHQLKTFVAQVRCVQSIVLSPVTIFKLNCFFFTKIQDVLCGFVFRLRPHVGCNLEKYSTSPAFFFFAQLSKWWMRAVRIYQECSHTVHLHGKKLKAKHNNSGTRSDANVFWKQKLKH